MKTPEEACAKEAHCFHRDSITLTSYPPKYRKTCCHCGKIEYEQPTQRRPPGEHGPFYNE